MGLLEQAEKYPSFKKPPIRTGLREVKVISVIRTLNCVGSGVEGDPVRTEWQYWTDDGEQITSEPAVLRVSEREIDRLADYLMTNFPEEITDGGAVDVAIKIMERNRK